MSLDRRLLEEALPNYDIGAELGRGGWGIVYEATHRSLTRPVAVKVLPRAFASDVEASTRFSDEARVIAALDHPHIVAVHDFLQHEGMLIIVMERLGDSLWDRMCRTGVAPDEAIAVVMAMCAALAEAHAVDCIHRDVKPENILFTAAGLPKLTDFGVAKMMGRSQPGLTQSGDAIGTPAYMAPEQATGRGIGPATDTYALATVLFELLSGDLPFPGADTAAAELFQRVHEPPLELTSVASVDERLAEVVMRALATDPADRPASATEFGVELASVAATLFGSGWLERSGVAVRADQRMMRAAVGSSVAPHVRPRGLTIGPEVASMGTAPDEDTVEREPRSGAASDPAPIASAPVAGRPTPGAPSGQRPSPPAPGPAPAAGHAPAPDAAPEWRAGGASDTPSDAAAPAPAPAGPANRGQDPNLPPEADDDAARPPAEAPSPAEPPDEPGRGQHSGSIAALAAASRSAPLQAPSAARHSGPPDLPPGHPEVVGDGNRRSAMSVVGSVLFLVIVIGGVVFMLRSGWFSRGGSSDSAATTTTAAETVAAGPSSTAPASATTAAPPTGALDSEGAPIPAAATEQFLGACQQFVGSLGTVDAAGAAAICSCTIDGVSGQIETPALEATTAAFIAFAAEGTASTDQLVDARVESALTGCIGG